MTLDTTSGERLVADEDIIPHQCLVNTHRGGTQQTVEEVRADILARSNNCLMCHQQTETCHFVGGGETIDILLELIVELTCTA